MKLGLGTAQFGLEYGISNSLGRPTMSDARAILARAKDAGVTVLDTAAQYGDSEAILGECLPTEHRFRIVTKTPVFKNRERIEDRELAIVRTTLAASLAKLRVPSIYALLLHRADDLFSEGGEHLYSVLQELKRDGLTTRIGVSIYTGAQLERIVDRFDLDLVQLPLNIFDQKLVQDGWLARLHQRGIEIHARSPFLQGLLLIKPQDLPHRFAPVRARLTEFHLEAERRGRTPLEIALSYVLSFPEVTSVICGVASIAQFDELVDVARSPQIYGWAEKFAVDDPIVTNPARWSELAV